MPWHSSIELRWGVLLEGGHIMCCVVGYVGKGSSIDIVLKGMARLEYRGYDSAGIGAQSVTGAWTQKVVGDVATLTSKLMATDLPKQDLLGAIGHTRWSTHGVVSEQNAHPVIDCLHSCLVVHNGIIENEAHLRAQLAQQHHRFTSETDSELIAHLLEAGYAADIHCPHALLAHVVKQLEGSYAFVAIMNAFPGMLLVARQRSPLCIIKTPEGMMVASDQIAGQGAGTAVQFLPDGTYGTITATGSTLYAYTGATVVIPEECLAASTMSEAATHFPHMMLHEIHQQPDVIARCAAYMKQLNAPAIIEQLARAPRIIITGSGTSYHAALMLQYYIEEIARIPVSVTPASEARDCPSFVPPHSWIIALSQSGETADTLETMRWYLRQGYSVLALTNVTTSSMAREATHTLPLHAGTEVAVASTKTFVAHLALGYALAHRLACAKGLVAKSPEETEQALQQTASLIASLLTELTATIDTSIAPRIARMQRAVFMGKRAGYVLAAEAALKLKELAYCFTETQYGGELKHGPLALIEPELPVIVWSSSEPTVYRKLVANVHEVRARRGHIVAVALDGQDELCAAAHEVLMLPRPIDSHCAPFLMAVVAQYIAYSTAVILGKPVDKPRNLAKSVTVE